MTYKSYIGELDFDGRPHGQGRHKYSDGSSYTGDYKAGVYHGQGTLTYPDGREQAGTWNNGKFEEP